MPRRYPHLQGSTNYPDLDTVDVWEYRNTFDYSRWEAGTIINVLKVPWDATYENVPWWESDASRDEWFDARSEEQFRFMTRFQVAPDGTIKLPIPYGTLMRYDYLYVEIPTPTSAAAPLDYATGPHRYYYFITDALQTAPSTTLCTLALDVWTTWMHAVKVSHLMLERGHAPMASTDVDTYLADPAANTAHLLAPDVNYGAYTTVSNSTFVPLGAGRKYVLFATSTSPSQLASMQAAITGSTAGTPPTYFDIDARNGYQVGVSGYVWGNPAGKIYEGMKVPSQTYVSDGRIPNGYYCYAIVAEEALAFWQSVAADMPTLLVATEAMFVIPEEYFRIESTIDVLGYPVHRVLAASDVSQHLELTRDLFGYPEEIAGITKLYTSPYSELEFTDDNGNSAIFRVEQCGNLRLHAQIALAYPYLRMSAFLTGVCGSDSTEYTWRQLNGASATHKIWADDFARYMLAYDIPTYQLSIDAGTLESLRSYKTQASARASALNSYQNGTRSSNTSYENSLAGNATAKTNSDASATVARTNVTNNSNNAIANTNIANDLDDANQVINNGTMNALADSNKTKITYDAADDISQNNAMKEITIENTAISGAASAAGSAVNAIGAAITGNAIGYVSALGASLNSAFTSWLATSKEAAVTTATNAAVRAHQSNAVNNITEQNTFTRNAATDIKDNNTEARSAKTSNDTNTANTNATNTFNASVANSARTKATNDANAGYTRETSIQNGKASLELAQGDALRSLEGAAMTAPSRFGTYASDPYPDEWQRRGVSVKVRTQPEGALRMAAAEMLRYGYYAHEPWETSELCLMSHFTYWQASDVWVTDLEGITTGNAVQAIKTIFKTGVTIWQNPDEIGQVSIYANA